VDNSPARVDTSGSRASRHSGAGIFDSGMFTDAHFHPPHRRGATLGLFLAS
jgi:hypothetical protein